MPVMPSGAVPTTNKTEFMRYLNVYGVMVPALRKRLREYNNTPNSMTFKHDSFGMCIRTKHRLEFDAVYARFWLRRTDLYGKVYENVTG